MSIHVFWLIGLIERILLDGVICHPNWKIEIGVVVRTLHFQCASGFMDGVGNICLKFELLILKIQLRSILRNCAFQWTIHSHPSGCQFLLNMSLPPFNPLPRRHTHGYAGDFLEPLDAKRLVQIEREIAQIGFKYPMLVTYNSDSIGKTLINPTPKRFQKPV